MRTKFRTEPVAVKQIRSHQQTVSEQETAKLQALQPKVIIGLMNQIVRRREYDDTTSLCTSDIQSCVALVIQGKNHQASLLHIPYFKGIDKVIDSKVSVIGKGNLTKFTLVRNANFQSPLTDQTIPYIQQYLGQHFENIPCEVLSKKSDTVLLSNTQVTCPPMEHLRIALTNPSAMKKDNCFYNQTIALPPPKICLQNECILA